MNKSSIFEEDFSFEDSKTNETEEKIDIFAPSNEEPKVEEDIDIEKLKRIEHDKKIERIQVFLILFLIVVGSLVYFFGYDFLKPFIKVD